MFYRTMLIVCCVLAAILMIAIFFNAISALIQREVSQLDGNFLVNGSLLHATADASMGDMVAKRLNPILNVSEIRGTFAWFEKLGWQKLWEWGDPPTFGAVCSGECVVFVCEGGQGGRGKGDVRLTFGPEGDQSADKGVWMSVWVDDVDAVHRHCIESGLEVTWPPADMPWGVREMHVRHPDGHVFRITQGRG